MYKTVKIWGRKNALKMNTSQANLDASTLDIDVLGSLDVVSHPLSVDSSPVGMLHAILSAPNQRQMSGPDTIADFKADLCCDIDFGNAIKVNTDL